MREGGFDFPIYNLCCQDNFYNNNFFSVLHFTCLFKNYYYRKWDYLRKSGGKTAVAWRGWGAVPHRSPGREDGGREVETTLKRA